MDESDRRDRRPTLRPLVGISGGAAGPGSTLEGYRGGAMKVVVVRGVERAAAPMLVGGPLASNGEFVVWTTRKRARREGLSDGGRR